MILATLVSVRRSRLLGAENVVMSYTMRMRGTDRASHAAPASLSTTALRCAHAFSWSTSRARAKAVVWSSRGTSVHAPPKPTPAAWGQLVMKCARSEIFSISLSLTHFVCPTHGASVELAFGTERPRHVHPELITEDPVLNVVG